MSDVQISRINPNIKKLRVNRRKVRSYVQEFISFYIKFTLFKIEIFLLYRQHSLQICIAHWQLHILDINRFIFL